jgi:putative DNA primase/helicase
MVREGPSLGKVPAILAALNSHGAGVRLAAARAYVGVGLSLVPMRADGSKAPQEAGWRTYSDRQPTDAELVRWFCNGRYGIGITGGPASGCLVIFDFETRPGFDRWCAALDPAERAALAGCPVVFTPSGGVHIYIRLTEPVKGAMYARDIAGKCLIETRGNGHIALAPGSPASCHPTGKPYRLVRVGWLDGRTVEPMDLHTFHALTVRAADLNEYVRPAPREVIGDYRRTSASDPVGDRPGDHFNIRVSWSDVLTPHEWRVYQSNEERTYWSRPGKNPPGVSASTGFCRGESGNDLLYVFSTSAGPFEAERSYSKFAAYTLLHHHGDFRLATRALAVAGYGPFRPVRRRGGR